MDTEETNTEEDVLSPLDMSDEDVEKLLLSDDQVIDPSAEVEEPSQETEEEEDAKEEETTDDSKEEEEETSKTEEESEPDLAAEGKNAFEDSKGTQEPKEKKDTKKAAATEESDSEDDSKVDYEAAYKQLTAPFRANGKDMQINTVDDALTLMKMGANYNKKMAGLKPNLRLLKMLEKNNLLDESKLSYLIDLDQKNPEAINKLVKESGVDPLDIDTEKESEYSPTTYTVDDKEVELDGVLDEIRETSTFKDTLSIISNKWDDSSKQVLYENPSLIKTINDHVDSGVYGQITSVIERERMLGRMEGMSDIQAYKYVGDAIMANGGFNTSDSEEQTDTDISAIAPTTTKKEDPKLKERKRAASSTKSTTKAPAADFNPLEMSDEDFEKASSGQFL